MSLDAVFCPNSIALVGASRDEMSVGFSLLKNLLSETYKGEVYPVNPKAQEVAGKKCYANLAEIGKPIDLVIVAIPAPFVANIVKESVQCGVKAIVVISAGFKEAGEEGKKRENELIELAHQHNIALIGPNCLGILNPHVGLNASFETVMPAEGKIAFVSQSGALVSSLLDIANTRGIGFSKIVSVGNKAAIEEHDLLPYLFQDEQTSVILLYAETLKNAPELISLLRENQKSAHPKAVIMLKAGASTAGQHASSSHTGSLAGSDGAYEALVAQSGMIRVKTVNDLLTTAQVLATNAVLKGSRIAIITNAGGPGIIATDESERQGLTLANLAEETKKQLQTVLPSSSHVANPIDVLGDATSVRYNDALTAVAKDPGVDCILTILTPQSMTDILKTAEIIINLHNISKVPLVTSFIGATHVNDGVVAFSRHGITHAQFPEDGVIALGHAASFSAILSRNIDKPEQIAPKPDIRNRIEDLCMRNVTLVETQTVFDLLSSFDIPVVRHALVQSKEDAEKIASSIGDTLALKVVSPDISHKTDVGGVLLRVKKEDAGNNFLTLLENVKSHAPQAKTHGVLLTEMIEGDGLEMILGIKKEPGLGTMIVLGMGGIFVELLKDAVFRFAPLTRFDTQQMIDELQAKQLLYGFRGRKKRDLEIIMKTLLSLSHLVMQVPEIEELDINPFFLREEGHGGVVLDARIILKRD